MLADSRRVRRRINIDTIRTGHCCCRYLLFTLITPPPLLIAQNAFIFSFDLR